MGLLAEQPLATLDLQWVDATGSTNADLLLDLSTHAAAGWSIRIASKQIGGRGRQGRSWESPNGSIAISIAIELNQFKPAPNWLSMITAVALTDSLNKFSSEPIKIKWPNDCLAPNGKVAGILVERNENFAVIGVGINFFAAPKIATATHLSITDYVPALAVFIGTLVNQIVGTADLSDSQVKEFIRPKLSTLGQMVEVQLVSGEMFVGSAVSISDTGALIVDKNSELLEIVSGDVIHLRSADAR